MKISFTILACFFQLLAFSQGRVIINNNAFVVIDNGAKLVLENGNANAFSTSGTGGNLVSEHENDEVVWNIGTNTGTYTLPYTTKPVIQGGNGTKIPLIVDLTNAGTGSGRIEFSSYETATDANTVFPSMVTNVATPLNVVDRFWMIDVENYTVNPEALLTFTYDDAVNEIGATNTIVEANLQAQRYNTPINDWELLLFGVADPVGNTVSNVLVLPAEFYEAWTLVTNVQPLPVTDLNFDAIKVDREALLKWTTSSELNSDYYSVQRSNNGVNWTEIGVVQAAGSSQNLIDYNFTDPSPVSGINYYRINQFDQDGSYFTSEVRSLNFGGPVALVYPNPFKEVVYIECEGSFSVEVSDPLGRIILSGNDLHQIDMANYGASFYQLRIFHSNGDVQHVKLVKH